MGARQTLKRLTPHLFVEVHQGRMGKHKTKEFLRFLANSGYKECVLVSELTAKYKLFLPLLKLYSGKWDFRFEGNLDEVVEMVNGLPDVYYLFVEGKQNAF